MTQTFIVDTDILGVNDDAFALHYLLTHGHVPSMITSCSGNGLASASAQDAESLLAAYGLQLAGGVQPGPDRPIGWTARIRRAHRKARRELGRTAHLGELGGDRALPGERLIDYAVCPRDEDIAYLALGPLGNLDQALTSDQLASGRIQHLVFSGGAFTAPGNVGPHAEFNVFADPLAAQHVLDAGLRRITVVPLDVTTELTYGLREFEHIAASSSVFGHDLKRTKQEVFQADPDFREPIWDLVAAVVMFQPEVIVRSRHAAVTVDSAPGETLGATTMLAADERPSVEVVLAVDEEAIRTIMCACAGDGGQ